MNRNYARATWLAVWLLVVLTPALSAASPRAYWAVRPIGAGEAGRGWVMPGGEASVEIDASIVAHEDSTTAIVLQPGFFSRVSIELVSTRTARVAGIVRAWPGIARCPGFGTCAVDDRIVLEPAQVATVRATLTSVDGRPFPEDDYELRVGLTAARELVQGQDAPESRPLTVTVLAYPLSIREATVEAQRAVLLARAADALGRRDFETALAFYQKSAAPHDRTVLSGSSIALIALKRFKEAAAMLERLMPEPGTPDRESLVPVDLAIVYFALGEDQKAEDVIKRHMPPASFAETAARLRAAGVNARNR